MPAINITDLNNAQLDVNTIASVATSSALTVTDRLGNTKNTLSGFNAALLASSASLQASVTVSNAAVLASAAAVQGSIGYLPPVAYAAGISLTVAVQTVSYSGQTYAPILSALPFTTSGTFETAQFRLIQGVAAVDLANSVNAAKGAALIGDKGSTVSGAFSVGLRRPRKLFSKLFASASAVTPLKIIPTGDSLAIRKIQNISAALDRKMGGTSGIGVNTAGNLQSAGTGSAGLDLNYGELVNAVPETSQYAYWLTGDVMRIDAAGSTVLVASGGTPTFTSIDVFYFTEPNAGTLNLIVAGATVATANANAAVGLSILSYVQADGQSSVSLGAVGGSVRIAFSHTRRGSQSGVDRYDAFQKGGLLLSNPMSSATCRANVQAAIAAISPDFITFEMDDEFGTGTSDQAAFTSLLGIWDAVAPNADKLIIASTPRAAVDTGKLASSNYLKGATANKDASYLFFDSYYLLGSYAQMGAIFGTDDGVHPNASANAFAAEIMWDFLGLNSPTLGFMPRAVNDPSTPSRLARNTLFQGANDSVSVETDASFGFDWNIKFPRVLSISTRGNYGTPNAPIAQFSGNVGVAPNILPLGWDFGTSGSVRKFDTNSASGPEFSRFRKTDNPNGFMNLETGLIRSNFTRAQLLALPANSLVGAIAFCTDCAGGAQLAYARGTFPTDWVAVDGKTAI